MFEMLYQLCPREIRVAYCFFCFFHQMTMRTVTSPMFTTQVMRRARHLDHVSALCEFIVCVCCSLCRLSVNKLASFVKV